MNRYSVTFFVLMVLAFTGQARAQTATKYAVLVDETVNAFQTGSVIFDKTIDTEGYSDIRLFVHVFAENYANNPITDRTRINVTLFHNSPCGSFSFSSKQLTSDVTSYINGWFSEKIIGNKTRIVGHAKDFPQGPYTIAVTYYLVK